MTFSRLQAYSTLYIYKWWLIFLQLTILFANEKKQRKRTKCEKEIKGGESETSVEPPRSLKTCTGCRSVSYCSKFCQRRDWPYHKHVCEKLARRTKEAEGDADSADTTGKPKTLGLTEPDMMTTLMQNFQAAVGSSPRIKEIEKTLVEGLKDIQADQAREREINSL